MYETCQNSRTVSNSIENEEIKKIVQFFKSLSFCSSFLKQQRQIIIIIILQLRQNDLNFTDISYRD